MIQFIKNLFKNKPKPPCAECKETGETLKPTFQIGNMTEYEVKRCECMTKKKR